MKALSKTVRNSALLVAFAFVLVSLGVLEAANSPRPGQEAKPTIVLVHGAFAESSSWNGVVKRLLADDYPVIAVAVPLRGLQSDADYVATVFRNVHGPIVAVGHSYGGSVITVAATGNPDVKALVFVAGVAPDQGESVVSLTSRFPGGTLGPTLAPPVILPNGGKDLYIQQDKFPAQFAADVPKAEAKIMAATQRPITDAALNELSGPPAWKTIPSWFIFGSLDKNIPEAAHKFMAQRANAKMVVEVKGASHVVMISHPDEVAAIIRKAAESVTP
jgi:pimeloyl-ACP methyl ester carboxylesterase